MAAAAGRLTAGLPPMVCPRRGAEALAPGDCAALAITQPVFYAETERFREGRRLLHARSIVSA